MSRYNSGRKFAYAIAERLSIPPELFVDAMKEADMPLTEFDRLNENNALLEPIAKSVRNKALTGLRKLQEQRGATPEITESIERLEARGFKTE